MWWLIADFPETVAWLTEEEKEFVKARLEDDVGDSGLNRKPTFKEILRVFKDCESKSLTAFRSPNSDRRGFSPCRCWCFHVPRIRRPCLLLRLLFSHHHQILRLQRNQDPALIRPTLGLLLRLRHDYRHCFRFHKTPFPLCLVAPVRRPRRILDASWCQGQLPRRIRCTFLGCFRCLLRHARHCLLV